MSLWFFLHESAYEHTTVAALPGSAHPSGWNVTLYLQFKRFFSFFHPISNLPHQSFWGRFNPKRDYKMVYESSKGSSAPRPQEKNIDRDACSIQHHTNPSDPRITTPTYIQSFQRRCFSFPIDINFGWPHTSVTHPYQHKYWNILLLAFHNYSTPIKFPKFN